MENITWTEEQKKFVEEQMREKQQVVQREQTLNDGLKDDTFKFFYENGMKDMIEKDKSILDSEVIPREFSKEFKAYSKITDDGSVQKSLLEEIAEYEKQLIHQALIDSDWNQSLAARKLKISERTIRYKMKKLGIRKIS